QELSPIERRPLALTAATRHIARDASEIPSVLQRCTWCTWNLALVAVQTSGGSRESITARVSHAHNVNHRPFHRALILPVGRTINRFNRLPMFPGDSTGNNA